MTDEEIQKEKKRRAKRARDNFLICLAVFLAPTIGDARKFVTLEDVPTDLLSRAKDLYKANFADIVDTKVEGQMKTIQMYKQQFGEDYQKKIIVPRDEQNEISQVTIQKDIGALGSMNGVHRYKILNPGDGKTCSTCRKWLNKTVSDQDGTLQQWENSGALHPNCRCSIHPLDDIQQVEANAKDYLQRKKERIQEYVKYKMAYHEAPTSNIVFV